MKQDCGLPKLTHLQFIIVFILLNGEHSGREMRSALANQGVDKFGPVFYQTMARMEEYGFVEGWYVQTHIGDQDFTERCYRITDKGRELCDSTLKFYAEMINAIRTKKDDCVVNDSDG